VAESGITCAADASRVRSAGYDMALVGSALMRSSDPEELLRQMLRAGRT
jgi:indole-3-glycerol phosphate synthase